MQRFHAGRSSLLLSGAMGLVGLVAGPLLWMSGARGPAPALLLALGILGTLGLVWARTHPVVEIEGREIRLFQLPSTIVAVVPAGPITVAESPLLGVLVTARVPFASGRFSRDDGRTLIVPNRQLSADDRAALVAALRALSG